MFSILMQKMLQPDPVFHYSLFHHPNGYELEKGISDGVQYALADVFFTDIERHTAL
jgi:hypothetical protein